MDQKWAKQRGEAVGPKQQEAGTKGVASDHLGYR